jgi:hypothetical protein
MQQWLRVCGYMRQKESNPLMRPLRHEFVCKTIVCCESRLPIYACTHVRHTLLHFHDEGGWLETIGPGPSLQKYLPLAMFVLVHIYIVDWLLYYKL